MSGINSRGRLYIKVNGLAVGDMSLLMRDLQLPPSKAKARELRTALRSLIDFVGEHFDEHGEYPTRNKIYQKFVTVDGTNVAESVLDRHKPFSIEYKQIIDLAYVTNLADALRIFSTSPQGALNRAALQELQARLKSGEEEFNPSDFLRILKNIVFEATREVIPFSGLGFLSPASIYKVRKSQAYSDYIHALEQFVDATPETLGVLFTASETKALETLVYQRKALAREITAQAAAAAVQNYIEHVVIFLQSAGVTIKIAIPNTQSPLKVEVDGLKALKLAAPPLAKISVKLALGAMDGTGQHDFSSVYELVTYRTREPYEQLRSLVSEMQDAKSVFDVHERGAGDDINEEAAGQSADKPRVEY